MGCVRTLSYINSERSKLSFKFECNRLSGDTIVSKHLLIDSLLFYLMKSTAGIDNIHTISSHSYRSCKIGVGNGRNGIIYIDKILCSISKLIIIAGVLELYFSYKDIVVHMETIITDIDRSILIEDEFPRELISISISSLSPVNDVIFIKRKKDIELSRFCVNIFYS